MNRIEAAEQARKDKLANEDAKSKEQQRKAAEKKAAQEERARALEQEKNAAGFFETIGKGMLGEIIVSNFDNEGNNWRVNWENWLCW